MSRTERPRVLVGMALVGSSLRCMSSEHDCRFTTKKVECHFVVTGAGIRIPNLCHRRSASALAIGVKSILEERRRMSRSVDVRKRMTEVGGLKLKL